MDKEVVVITGAGSGLGASLAMKYSEMGAHVCLLGRNKGKLQNVAELTFYIMNIPFINWMYR